MSLRVLVSMSSHFVVPHSCSWCPFQFTLDCLKNIKILALCPSGSLNSGMVSLTAV